MKVNTSAKDPVIATGSLPEQPDWIKEAMERADELLDPELETYLMDSGGPFGVMLKHPLVFSVPFFESMAYRANDQLAWKKEKLEKALADHDWSQVVWLHERPHRAQAFADIADRITHDQLYWELLADVYTDTENFWQESRLWQKLLTSERSCRQLGFMTPEEYNELCDMPATVTVYRGINGRGKKRSWAWTLDRDKAIWFAQRLNREGIGKPSTLVTGTVERRHAVGYLTGRGESELVVNPKYVTVTKSEEV